MTAPTTPAKVTLADGKERVLRFSTAALKTIKKEFGASIFRANLKEFFDKIDEESLSRILFLGLRHKFEGGDMDITEEALDELVDAQMLGEILPQLIVAIGGSLPAEKNAPAPEVPKLPEIPSTTVM